MSGKITLPHRIDGAPLRRLSVEVIGGPDAGRRHTSEEDQITIGSGTANDLILTDETVSRCHVELTRASDRIRVRDLSSTNGTSFHGCLIESGLLPSGSVLSLGRTTLSISDAESISVPMHGEERFGEFIGRSAAIRRLMARLERAAASSSSVLVIGETGTGKELIARAIHEHSTRAHRAFETVDCGALLPTLIASELFGHERGAFTGADHQHIGAFERADGGTLFLDEIGEVPVALQPALLGALERRTFRRIGGTQPIEVDVRVVAATHRDLRGEINHGRFREDLYYRIAVVTLVVPPLRERPEDLPLLVEHFLQKSGSHARLGEVFSERAMDALGAHHWPGNVRELRNYVEAAVVMGEVPAPAGKTSSEADVTSTAAPRATRSYSELLRKPYGEGRSAVLAEFESAYLEDLIGRTNGNISEAARTARMNRSYLNRMLKRHGIR